MHFTDSTAALAKYAELKKIAAGITYSLSPWEFPILDHGGSPTGERVKGIRIYAVRRDSGKGNSVLVEITPESDLATLAKELSGKLKAENKRTVKRVAAQRSVDSE